MLAESSAGGTLGVRMAPTAADLPQAGCASNSESPVSGELAALDRALPGWAIDAITNGVPTRDARVVWTMCLRIAMSAYRRGWSEDQYLTEIAGMNSRLWVQLMTRRDGRTSTGPATYKSLRKAWSAGVANANNVGARTHDEIRADAVELAYKWTDRLDSRVDGLNARETAVMVYVINQTERRGMLRVTCPRRGIAESAGVGEEAVKGALARLTVRGLLVKHSAGRRGEPGKGKAAIYGLANEVGGRPMEEWPGNTP